MTVLPATTQYTLRGIKATEPVDVAERTFFRYFASKEELALSFVKDGAQAFAEASGH